MDNPWRKLRALNPETELWWDSSPLVWPNFREDFPKSLSDKDKELFLLVNSSRDMEEAREVHQQLASVVSRFLGHSLNYLGSIPKDNKVCESVRLQTPLMISHPRSFISRCFQQIAAKLIKRPPMPGQFDSFMQKTE